MTSVSSSVARTTPSPRITIYSVCKSTTGDRKETIISKSTVTEVLGTAGVSTHIPSDIPRPLVAEGEAHVPLLVPIVAAPRSTSKREDYVDEFYSD